MSLHTIYGEPESPRERCDYAPEDFRRWIDWAKKLGIGLDYNPTFFAHPMMKGGFSLASPDKAVRDYWVKVGIGSREIAAAFGRELGTPAWNDLWVPDGMKDLPANRLLYREYLRGRSTAFMKKPFDAGELVDVVEEALRHRYRELYRRIARLLPRLCAETQPRRLHGHRPLSPHGVRRR